jgi:hypothetical protein
MDSALEFAELDNLQPQSENKNKYNLKSVNTDKLSFQSTQNTDASVVLSNATPLQKMAAACSGALLTSLFSKFEIFFMNPFFFLIKY